MRSAIRKTHWHDLDLLASNLAFYGAEFSIASRLASEEGFNFFTVLANGLETVKHDYDVVIMDTAPVALLREQQRACTRWMASSSPCRRR